MAERIRGLEIVVPRSSRVAWIAYAVVVITGLLASCAPEDGGRQFSAALGSKLRTERPTEVDLATVASFAWDELFVFEPYSTRDDNCKVLQLDFIECRTTFPAMVDEGEYLLVFRRNARLARAERHRRMNGDFYAPASKRPQPVRRSAARFMVVPMPADGSKAEPRYRLEYKG